MSLNIFTTMCMLCKTVSTSSLVKLTWKVFCRWGSNLLTTDVALRFMRKKQRTQKTALGTDLANALSRRIHQRRNNLSGVIGYFAYRIQKHVDTTKTATCFQYQQLKKYTQTSQKTCRKAGLPQG